MVRFARSLFGQVLIALILGVGVGLLLPSFALQLKPLGDGFIQLIKMLIPYIVFCVVVHGIAEAGDLKSVGRVGFKTLIYFEAVTTIALLIGLLVAYIFEPGVGMNVDVHALDASGLSKYNDNVNKLMDNGFVGFLMALIPKTITSAFADGNVLQVLLFALLFGSALSALGSKAQLVTSFIAQASNVFFKIMGFIIRLAPIGVFGAIAFTIAKYGIGSFMQLGLFVLLYFISVLVFVVVVLGIVMKLCGFNLWKFLRYFKSELAVVFATTSSDSVLPQVMDKLKKLGIKDSTVGLVIPTGYSFNLDAFSIYITMAAVFIAQATNTPITMGDLLSILVIALITSKGAHGVPGSAIVILAATLHAIPAIPAVGLILILSIDWFIGIPRALGNLIGNCVATVAIASWEGTIDKTKAKQILDNPIAI